MRTLSKPTRDLIKRIASYLERAAQALRKFANDRTPKRKRAPKAEIA